MVIAWLASKYASSCLYSENIDFRNIASSFYHNTEVDRYRDQLDEYGVAYNKKTQCLGFIVVKFVLADQPYRYS